MKKILFLMTAFLLIAGTTTVYAQTIVTPPSTSLRTPGVPHTHLFIFIPEGGPQPSIPNGETPASIACVYGLVAPTSGCPKNGSLLPTGGGPKAIAVVEYGLYANAQADFNAYNAQWGLSSPPITQICYPAPPCPNNAGTGWDLETALDVQIAHAMAPNAAIYIAGFTNDPLGDGAEQLIAARLVSDHLGGEVSNSWTYNGGEGWCSPPSNCELSYDGDFAVPGIVYFAAAGDAGAQVNYPCISPNVACAGGTHINRDSGGNFTGTESCWNGSGGGISVVEPRPSYQNIPSVKAVVGNFRGIPDMSADADPASGVAVYSSTYCGGWCVVGGTSVASPLLAGYVNNAGHFLATTNAELYKTYITDSLNSLGYWYNPGSYPPYPPFFDITTGGGGRATPGWDKCTGIGSPRTLSSF